MNHPRKNRKILIWLLIILSSLILIFTGISLTKYFFYSSQISEKGITAGPNTKGLGPNNNKSDNRESGDSTNPQTKAVNSDQNTSTGKNENLKLIPPWGTFFNNSPAKITDKMGSTCNSTVGANCQIIF